MSKLIKLYYLLSIIATFFYVVASVDNQINNGNAKLNLNKRQDVKDIINEIQNLIIDNIDTYENPEKLEEMVNNNENNDKKNLLKRQIKNEVVKDIINEIHNLIVDNVDTYENPEKLEDLINNNEENDDRNKLLKRQVKDKIVENIVNEIQNLIVDNVDTYENPEKLEEMISNNENNDRKTLFKRQEEKEEKENKEEEVKVGKNNDVVNNVIKQIHNLIINNKDTYKDPKKLEELANGKLELRRRNINNN